jgi:hemerythrin-like domain-containing protein
MSGISDYLTAKHRNCDGLLAEAEAAIDEGRWEDAAELYASFRRETNQHFKQEEEVLFPLLEQAVGSPLGPIEIMRIEHDQIRRLLATLDAAMESGDSQRFLGESDTLLTLMQQHNLKEENVLYRAADQRLGANANAIIDQMRSL